MTPVVGILGVGHLAGYLVEGLFRAGDGPDLVLSPRNAERSLALAGRFGARRARDNRDVVSRSRMVLLSTPPVQALEAVAGLPWNEGHLLVSVAPGVPLDALRSMCRPATVVRAMPVSCAAIGESPTSLFPDHDDARRFFERLGPVFLMPDEASFDAATVVGAFYAWVHALLLETAGWLQSAGVDDESSRRLAARAARGAAGMVLARPDEPIEDMLRRLATVGGLTESGLAVLGESGALAAWSRACDAALEKIRRFSTASRQGYGRNDKSCAS